MPALVSTHYRWSNALALTRLQIKALHPGEGLYRKSVERFAQRAGVPERYEVI